MTDNKARRVTVKDLIDYTGDRSLKGKRSGHYIDDPNGTHMLVPVEVWERNRNLLKDAEESLSALMCGSQAKALHDFLAEIGGDDE